MEHQDNSRERERSITTEEEGGRERETSVETEELDNEFRNLKVFENLNLEEYFIPEQQGLHRGKLENGLTYYVHSISEHSYTTYLPVKVGSTSEDEDECGLAHMLEHLAFAAVEFKDPIVRKYLDTVLESEGPCQLGVTSCDYTLYSIPAQNQEELSYAIDILAAISSEVKVCDEHLERVRGVVMNEYDRQLEDVEFHRYAAYASLRFDGTKYEKLVIGKPEVIKGVSTEKINQLYQKWYRLPMMAIIIVGDIDSQSTVELIKTTFGPKDSRVQPSLTLDLSVPLFTDPRFLCFTHPLTKTGVQVTFCARERESKSLRDLRDNWAERMFIIALQKRLDKASDHDQDFSCFASIEFQSHKTYNIHGWCKQVRIVDTLEVILTELARIRVHGFHEDEISAVQVSFLLGWKGLYLGGGTLGSNFFAKSYYRNFLYGKTDIDIAYGAHLAGTLVPVMSKDEVQRFSHNCRTTSNCCIMTMERRPYVRTGDLLYVVDKINSLEENRVIYREVEDPKPTDEGIFNITPGTVMEKIDCPKVDATELLLSNGMRVCYKTTDMGGDMVSLEGFSYGGLSEVSENDYLSCSLAREIASLSGICHHEYRAPKRVDVSFEVFITYFRRSFAASFPFTCIEAALMLVYSLFTTNKEPEEQLLKEAMDYMESDLREGVRLSLADYVKELNSGTSYYFESVSLDRLKRVDPMKACQYFNNCFRDPSNFVVVLAGKIDPDIASPLILQYLAGIPKPPVPVFCIPRENLKAILFSFPETVVRKEIVKREECICWTAISFPLKIADENLDDELCLIVVLCRLIKLRLIRKLRLLLGQTYAVDVGYSFDDDAFSLFGTGNSYMMVTYSSAGDIAWYLVDNALDEIEKLQNEGPMDDISTVDGMNKTETNHGWTASILRTYWSRHYHGALDSAYEVHNNRPMTAESVKFALQRLLPFPCRERYTACVLKHDEA